MCRVKEHELRHVQSVQSVSERESLVSQEDADAARGATLRLQGELRQLHARLARMQQEQRSGGPTTWEHECSCSLTKLIPLEGVSRASPGSTCTSDALLTAVEEVQGFPPLKCLMLCQRSAERHGLSLKLA